MAKSLADQLLAAGAVDKSRATKIKKAKHKQAKQRARGAALEDEVKLKAQQAQAEKFERDRELSRERQTELDKRAVAAQIRQLIERNAIDHEGGDHAYNFSDAGVVKKLFVSDPQQVALAGGRLAIVCLDPSYAIVPSGVAAKISERDPSVVLVLNADEKQTSGVDDEYAAYEIPDDLTW